jgi:hypothetical protein
MQFETSCLKAKAREHLEEDRTYYLLIRVESRLKRKNKERITEIEWIVIRRSR